MWWAHIPFWETVQWRAYLSNCSENQDKLPTNTKLNHTLTHSPTEVQPPAIPAVAGAFTAGRTQGSSRVLPEPLIWYRRGCCLPAKHWPGTAQLKNSVRKTTWKGLKRKRQSDRINCRTRGQFCCLIFVLAAACPRGACLGTDFT